MCIRACILMCVCDSDPNFVTVLLRLEGDTVASCVMETSFRIIVKLTGRENGKKWAAFGQERTERETAERGKGQRKLNANPDNPESATLSATSKSDAMRW